MRDARELSHNATRGGKKLTFGFLCKQRCNWNSFIDKHEILIDVEVLFLSFKKCVK